MQLVMSAWADPQDCQAHLQSGIWGDFNAVHPPQFL